MTDDRVLRLRPKKGTGLYLEVFATDCWAIEFFLGVVSRYPGLRFQLPFLLVEVGIMNREESDKVEKYLSPLK